MIAPLAPNREHGDHSEHVNLSLEDSIPTSPTAQQAPHNTFRHHTPPMDPAGRLVIVETSPTVDPVMLADLADDPVFPVPPFTCTAHPRHVRR